MPFGIDQEMWDKGRNDPVYFARTILGVNLHPGQEEFLRNFLGQKQYMLQPANQWGKSFSVAVALIWCAAYKANIPGWLNAPDMAEKMEYNPLYLTPKLRQARAVYGYILQILQSQFVWIKYNNYERRFRTDHRKRPYMVVRKTDYMQNECLLKDFLLSPNKVPSTQLMSTTPIQLVNNRNITIISTGQDQGASTAGGQFPIIFYDECCLDNHLQETLGNYLYSRTLKYNAPIVLISTPDQASESYPYFVQLCQEAQDDPDWKLQIGALTDNIFYSKEQVKKEEQRLKKLDPEVYRQVFFGEHVAGRGTFFRTLEVDRIFRKDNEFQSPQRGRKYVIGADFAASQAYTVFVVLDVTDGSQWDLVHLWREKGNVYSPDYQLEVLIDLAKGYNDAATGIDASSLAGPLLESRLHTLDLYANKFDGFAKKELLLALKKAITWEDKGRIRSPDDSTDKNLQALKRELHTYTEKDKGRVKDCVMALGLACWTMVQQGQEDVYDRPFSLDIFGRNETLKTEEEEKEEEHADELSRSIFG